ncbi:ATP-binding protein [Candidatus Halobeggiatoa sp. HSG11]|nr:ATP-binding protein [Candidatus Halobeggiatoa sp. HSG11]
MKLSYKFFIAFLLTNVISVALMIFIIHFNLSKNFMAFVNQRDTEILNSLNNIMVSEYQTQQSWNRLKDNQQLWNELLRPVSAKLKYLKRLPPPFGFDNRSPPNSKRDKRRRLHPFEKLALFDVNKNFVVGNASPFEKHITQPIIITTKTVGWVGIKKHRPRLKERRFLKRQVNNFYLTGICILLMTTLIVWWLSNHLLTPIQQLIKGTRALAARKFDTKITVKSTDELGQLADDFNMMAQTLQKYEQMRKQWLSDVSHELRTPLAIMQGEVEAIQDGIRDFNHDTLESLHSEVRSISRIVDDLHQLSAMETATLSFQKTAINPLVILHDTLRVFKTRLEQIQVQADMPVDVIIQGDTDRLTQLFSNLLENTLRYVDSPGTLKIYHEQDGDNLLINFVDSGPGVPEQSIEYLFDRFYRVEQSRNRTKGGSGLGLAICKNIVEMHGGDVMAINIPDNGLGIKITLPLFKQ